VKFPTTITAVRSKIQTSNEPNIKLN